MNELMYDLIIEYIVRYMICNASKEWKTNDACWKVYYKYIDITI